MMVVAASVARADPGPETHGVEANSQLGLANLLAHELGTPLALILGHLSLCIDGCCEPADDDLRARALGWLRGAEALRSLADSLCDAARGSRAGDAGEFFTVAEPLLVELTFNAEALATAFAAWQERAGRGPMRRTALLCRGQAVRLMALAIQLRAASKVLTPSIAPVLEDIELVGWLRSLVHRVGPAIVRTGHRLRLDAPRGRIMVSLDDGLLQLAMFNLLDNAQKFSNPGTMIRVRVGRTTTNGIIAVTDEGPGLPSGFQVRAFARHDVLADFLAPGIGVGASIVANAIALQGGSLRWGSRQDSVGTSVTITLPMADLE